MINACAKRVTEFARICKNKRLELDLIMYILNEVFTYYHNLLGTCFTTFDSRVAINVRKALTILKKLHPDYVVEYQDRLNSYLTILHSRSNHIDTIYNMPESVTAEDI